MAHGKEDFRKVRADIILMAQGKEEFWKVQTDITLMAQGKVDQKGTDRHNINGPGESRPGR